MINTVAEYFRPKEDFPYVVVLVLSIIEIAIGYYITTINTTLPFADYLLIGLLVISIVIDLIISIIHQRRNRRPDDKVVDDALILNRKQFEQSLNDKTALMKADSPLYIFPIESSFVNGKTIGFPIVKKRTGADFKMRYSTVEHSVTALFSKRIRTIHHYADLLYGKSFIVTEDTLLAGIDKIILSESTDPSKKTMTLSLFGPSYPQPLTINLDAAQGVTNEVVDLFMKSIN